jgi:hypothetical protein
MTGGHHHTQLFLLVEMEFQNFVPGLALIRKD